MQNKHAQIQATVDAIMRRNRALYAGWRMELDDPAGDADQGSVGDPAGDPPADDAGDNPPGADDLGDKGKKALDAMKADKKAAEARARDLEQQLAALQAERDGTAAEHAAALEAQRIKDEALAAANDRILKAELRAAATGKLADPADALVYLDTSEFEVSEDGAIDADALSSAIDDLLSKKPYLAAQGKRFEGSADGGARNDSTKPSQLTRADLKGMSHDQINEARAAGRLDDLLGLSK